MKKTPVFCWFSFEAVFTSVLLVSFCWGFNGLFVYSLLVNYGDCTGL